jgi:hypothetical protein
MKKIDRFKVVATIFCLSLVVLTFLPSAKADEWNRKTVVTFNEPIEVPGVGAQVLPAGTYVFKIFDSASDRHIVQIFNEREDHVFTTILAIPNYRLHATDKTVMTFGERAAGQPEAIRAWFYPGREWGEEFVYPKFRAVELAKITNQPVLFTPVELATAPVEVLKTVEVAAVEPTGEEVKVAAVVETPPELIVAKPVEVAATEPAATETLPQTASTLPLVALAGLLSLGAGLTLWGLSKRIV